MLVFHHLMVDILLNSGLTSTSLIYCPLCLVYFFCVYFIPSTSISCSEHFSGSTLLQINFLKTIIQSFSYPDSTLISYNSSVLVSPNSRIYYLNPFFLAYFYYPPPQQSVVKIVSIVRSNIFPTKHFLFSQLTIYINNIALTINNKHQMEYYIYFTYICLHFI